MEVQRICNSQGKWVHGVAKSQTRLSGFTFIFYFHTLKKKTATNSSVLAWRISETGEPDGLLSMGSHRVRHDWSDLASAIDTQLFPAFFSFPPFPSSFHFSFLSSTFLIFFLLLPFSLSASFSTYSPSLPNDCSCT